MSKIVNAVRPVITTTCDKTGLITSEPIIRPSFFKGVDVASVDVAKGLRAVLPEAIGDNERVTFRMFHASVDTCLTAVGCAVTFGSFLQSLSALAVANAYGQNLEQHFARMPYHTSYAVQLASTYLGKTESLKFSTLVEVMSKVLAELFLLPLKKPEVEGGKRTKKTAINAPVPAPIPAPIPAPVRSLAFGHEAHENSIRASDAALIFAPELELAIAREKARIAAQALADAEKADLNFIASFEAIAKNRPDFAIEQLRQMAELAGFKLVKKPAKKAA